jgi:hypothetical protein
MPDCRLCQHAVELRLDFGPQPLCNRFLAQPSDPETRHPLRLGQCPACGLLQLIEPPLPEVLKPARPMWYNEPEWHLDQVVDRIAALPGVDRDAYLCGLTYKEASTIERLRQRGYHNAVGLDAKLDWGVPDSAAGVETFQDRIGKGVLHDHPVHHGRYQVVIARHIIEHAHDLQGFVRGLKGLLAPGGYLILEIPDFTASVRSGNYATIWEEHVVYLTKATFPTLLQGLGLNVRQVITYPSPLEDLLVGVTQAVAPKRASPDGDVDVAVELWQGRQYAAMLPKARQAWKRALAAERAAGSQVALLGAGHLAIIFINLLELGPFIDFVVDDDSAKSGWYLPGSHLPVYSSNALHERNVRLCLMSVAPENERRVLERHHRFLQRGGRLASIFPGSQLTLERLGGGTLAE